LPAVQTKRAKWNCWLLGLVELPAAFSENTMPFYFKDAPSATYSTLVSGWAKKGCQIQVFRTNSKPKASFSSMKMGLNNSGTNTCLTTYLEFLPKALLDFICGLSQFAQLSNPALYLSSIDPGCVEGLTERNRWWKRKKVSFRKALMQRQKGLYASITKAKTDFTPHSNSQQRLSKQLHSLCCPIRNCIRNLHKYFVSLWIDHTSWFKDDTIVKEVNFEIQSNKCDHLKVTKSGPMMKIWQKSALKTLPIARPSDSRL
jgi:hypothetical protein